MSVPQGQRQGFYLGRLPTWSLGTRRQVIYVLSEGPVRKTISRPIPIHTRGKRLLYAIECKYKRQPFAGDLSGLRSFHEDHPEVPCLVVSPVSQSYRLAFARVLPPEKLLRELAVETV